MSDTDAARWPRIQELFREALRRPTGERGAFIERACGDDAGLLARIRELLIASETDIGLSRIVGSAAAVAAGADSDGLLKQRVGNYQMVSLLGVGGMGSVYLGTRIDAQFEHEVAIKVLRTSGSNDHFAERFRAERQVLANLHHPNIAQLLDGGVTDDGLQYFVMEYVRGEAIDRYCDARRLDIPQRLRLFMKICRAVDYAHRNLVIHRDVKPSNILVSDDGEPKLLDFGIAKVMSTAERITPLTVDSQRLMTPEYASPEQVRGEPVSTATDVYSLGVLLYRLLCGRGPYRVPNDLPSGLARAILESSPNKPSTALEMTIEHKGDEREGDEISAERQSTVSRLAKRLRGDLDTIALMALRKEPERRYTSARALHDDIENYLANRPISARADSAFYVTGKYVRRHRVGVVATIAFVVLAAAAVAQIIAERDRAEAEATTAGRVSDFLVGMLESANPYDRSPDVTARALLDRGARQIDAELGGQPLVRAKLQTTMARAYSSLGMQDTAAALAEDAMIRLAALPNVAAETGDTYAALASIEYERQDYASAKRMAEAALLQYAESPADVTMQIAMAKVELSKALMRLDETAPSLATAEEAVDAIQQQRGNNDPQANVAIANLSALYDEVGDYEAARVRAVQVAQWTGRTYGEEDLLMANPLHNLGKITWNLGDYRGANTYYERELAILTAALGPNHPSLHRVLASLASNQRKIGYESTAKSYYERAIAVLEGAESPPLGKLADTYGGLGTLLMDEGHLDEAEPLLRHALELNQKVYGIGNADNAFRLLHLGVLYRKREEYVEARQLLQQAIDATLSRYPESHRNVQIMRLHLGVAEGQAGNYAPGREMLQSVLQSIEATFGDRHPLAGQTLLELAALEIAAGHYETADEDLVSSLEIYRAARDAEHPDIRYALRLRAQIYEHLGDPERAAQFTAEADSLLERSQTVSEEDARKTKDAAF